MLDNISICTIIKNMRTHNIPKLVFSIIMAHSAGIAGSFFTVAAIPVWYEGIIKPSFNPPSWVFGPVWLFLYTLIGVALYLIWQKKHGNKKVRFVFIFFIAHLVINALWSAVFFGLQNILLALVVIVILWLMILSLIFMSWSIDKRASILLVPYFLWVSFATVLNFSILQLNF